MNSDKYDEVRKSIDVAYALINDEPTDRLDCINKTLKLLGVLNSGAVFLNGVVTSPYLEDFTEDDLSYIHEAFCDSAVPIIEMIEHFNEKSERETKENVLAV